MTRRQPSWIRMRPKEAASPEPVLESVPTSPISQVPIVIYVPPRCHSCGEPELRNYGTHRTPEWIDRYHLCRRCGRKFISRELLTFRPAES